MTLLSARTGERSRSVTRNALWNLLGALLPIPVALACFPVLAAGLGLERFGALGIAWMVLGYFGLFDFGLSQSTTRFAAAALAQGRHSDLRTLLASSLALHTALGLAGGAILASLAPWLARDALAMSAALSGETESALYWLAVSVPAIVVTAALRGMLEGLQRFDLVNLIRAPATVVNYVGPVIALPFGGTLPEVVAVIVVARFMVLAGYAAACLAALPAGPARIDGAAARRLATFGGWLAVSNFLTPLLIVADRFVIATSVSVAAVALYMTPYEVVTKAWILSASLMGALFPSLAALAESEPRSVRPTCRAAAVWLAAVAAPAIALLLGSADLLLRGWLGPEFSDGSTVVARLLGVGILVNIVAQVPLTALHAIGRADVTAKIVAVEFPVYIVAIWFSANHFGINGVAAIWAARTAVDAVLLFTAANRILPADADSESHAVIKIIRLATIGMFLSAFWLSALYWQDDLLRRCLAMAVLLPLLLFWEWSYLLRPLDREHVAMLIGRTSGSRIN